MKTDNFPYKSCLLHVLLTQRSFVHALTHKHIFIKILKYFNQSNGTKHVEQNTWKRTNITSCICGFAEVVCRLITKHQKWLKQMLIINNELSHLSPSNPIRRRGSGSTLAQVMTCCLTAPIHYPNQLEMLKTSIFDMSLKKRIIQYYSWVSQWPMS